MKPTCEIIKRMRLARGMSQKELATAAELAQPRISQIETGDWYPPREVLIRLARALKAPEVLLEALRHSPLLQEAMEMLGVNLQDPDPQVLIDRIRQELTMLEADIHSAGSGAPARAGMLVDMCHMLTLMVAVRSHCQ